MINDEKIIKNDERAIFALRSLYSKYGYSQFKMSRFEEYDLYVKNKDFLVSDEVITFTDRSGRLMALKPDVTLSIIKNSADKAGCVQKVYYNENVYRVSKGTHSFKEIMQAGLECIGDLHSYDIAEVVLLAVKSLSLINDKYVLDISHMGLVAAIFESSGLSHDGKAKAHACLHQKNCHELRAICADEGITEDNTNKLCALIDNAGDASTVLSALSPMLTTEKEKEAFEEFRILCDVIENSGYASCINLDFSVGNDMKYYSGVVFKGYIEGIPTSILSGGQYDKLMKKMGRTSGAIGFALYLDLLEQMDSPEEGYDIDTVLLYTEDIDPLTLTKAVEDISGAVSVLACLQKPKGINCRRILSITTDGRIETLEDND
ncbi:MAG: ATP phosphoribosyltransferase regulatory subunit [Ruminococcus sp.]|nr:ATP phosphoribosyltransferase regulatory subunit [Ruminococcus sp.]